MKTFKSISLSTSTFDTDKPAITINMQQLPRIDISLYVERLKDEKYKITAKVEPCISLENDGFMKNFKESISQIPFKNLTKEGAVLYNKVQHHVYYKLNQRKN